MAMQLETPPWQQQDYKATEQSTTAAPAFETPPWQMPGYKPPAPAAVVDDGYWHPQSEAGKYAANVVTGLRGAIPAFLGIPHDIGALGDLVGTWFGASNSPGYLTRNTSSAAEIAPPFYELANAIDKKAGFPGDARIYKPETGAGQFGQQILSSAPMAALGPGGLHAFAARQAANIAGIGAGDVAQQIYPDSPTVQLAAGLLGAAAGGGVPSVSRAGANIAGHTVGWLPESTIERQVANGLSRTAKVSGGELIDAIDNNLQDWAYPSLGKNLQPSPTIAEVTQNQGLRNAIYNDKAEAGRAGDPTYQTNERQSAQSQQAAVAAVAPNLAPDIASATAARDAELAGLAAPIAAQSAGEQFRTGLQTVYDQRLAAQRAAGNEFDLLANSPAVIKLTPVMDKATELATSNAGSVGDAYKAAAAQFRSGMGAAPLDTAPYAQSVLAGLNDLAQSYPAGSAANRAVLEIRDLAKNEIYAQAPEIEAAQRNYAGASRPMDIFNPDHTPGPIANAIQTTRFGGYKVPNDQVVSDFLKGTGAADALDKLHGVFPDREAATRSLQDFISSRVRSEAVNSDGSLNLAKMKSITDPYQNALMRFPQLRQQFSSVQGAQQALDMFNARQELIGKINSVPYGKPSDAHNFDNVMKDNQQLVQQTYGPAGAATLRQVEQNLNSFADTANSVRVRGQSGTSQSLAKASAVGGGIGGVSGTVMGAVLGHYLGDSAMSALIGSGLGGPAAAGAGALIGWRKQVLDNRIDTIRRHAYSDPIFARQILREYNNKLPSNAGRKAMDYVLNSMGGMVAPQTVSAPSNPLPQQR